MHLTDSFRVTHIRNSYHSNVILAFQIDLLPHELLKQIPYSTRHNWKNYNTSKLFGYEDHRINASDLDTLRKIAGHKKLLKAAGALIRINAILRSSLQSVRGHSKIMGKSSEQIIAMLSRYSSIGKEKILKWIGLTSQQVGYWRRSSKPCPSSLLELCRIRHPLQLTIKETKSIKTYLSNPDYDSWPGASVYYQILRDRAAYFALSTFYLYARKLGLKRNFKKEKARIEGIRAARPGQIIHIDITQLRLFNGMMVYIYHIVDNFSRFVFTCRAEPVREARITLENIKSVIRGFPQLFEERFSVLVDDGSENKGALDTYIAANSDLVTKLVAQKDIQFSNSMVEAANRILKRQYIQDREFQSIEALQNFLDNDYRKDFNNRPHYTLEGSTPLEVLNGDLPSPDRFADDIAVARRLRGAENRAYDCDSCSTGDLHD